MKTCVLCGKPFEPTSNAQRVCDRDHYRKCKYCGKEFLIHRPSDSKQCCSKKCTELLREQTMMTRYGVAHALQNEHIMRKSEDTQVERYGVKHAAQNEDIKNKVAAKFVEKYGVNTPFKMQDFQDKVAKTCLERYGVKYTSQIPGRNEKMQKTNVERYGSEYPLGNETIRDAVKQEMENKYGVPYYCMTDDCRSKQRQTISSENVALMDKLKKYGLESKPEYIKIDRYSYDIYVPERNAVIEVNPTYTHNAIGNHWGTGLPKNYHKEKTELAEKHGYRCINIWDWDCLDKVVDMLKPKEVIYARKCRIKDIDTKTANLFLDKYHLQRKVNGQKVCVGLYYDNTLVEVITLGDPRYTKKYEWELLRLCSDSQYIIVGGADRLWKYFLKNYAPESVISYCDRSKFEGSVYSRLGMILDHVTEPNKVWSKGSKSVTNNLLLQRGYDQIFHTDYGKGTSNEELMIENGWLPVYDCGQSVYVYKPSI